MVLGSEPGLGYNMKGPTRVHLKDEVPLISKNVNE